MAYSYRTFKSSTVARRHSALHLSLSSCKVSSLSREALLRAIDGVLFMHLHLQEDYRSAVHGIKTLKLYVEDTLFFSTTFC